MKLLIDIGNTRIKWGMEGEQGLEKTQAIEHKDEDYINQIKKVWEQLETPSTLALASVSKTDIVEQLTVLAKMLWPKCSMFIAKTSAQAFSVKNSYSEPSKLGIDRWLALIALRHYYPGNSAVVDCGTAITIDQLDEQGQHLGGIISLGVKTMIQSLYENTENLSQVEQQYTIGLSNNTEAAIYSGALYAATGLLEKIVTNLPTCQTVILTGGDAELLSKHLGFNFILEPNFILKGLSIYCKGEQMK